MEPFIIISYKESDVEYGRCGDGDRHIDGDLRIAVFDDSDHAAQYISKLNDYGEEQKRIWGGDKDYKHEILFAKQLAQLGKYDVQIDDFNNFYQFHSPEGFVPGGDADGAIEFGEWQGLSELRDEIFGKANVEDAKMKMEREERARKAKLAEEEQRRLEQLEIQKKAEQQERETYERLKAKFEK